MSILSRLVGRFTGRATPQTFQPKSWSQVYEAANRMDFNRPIYEREKR